MGNDNFVRLGTIADEQLRLFRTTFEDHDAAIIHLKNAQYRSRSENDIARLRELIKE